MLQSEVSEKIKRVEKAVTETAEAAADAIKTGTRNIYICQSYRKDCCAREIWQGSFFHVTGNSIGISCYIVT